MFVFGVLVKTSIGVGSKQPLSGSGFHHGLGKDSREITLQQGSLVTCQGVSINDILYSFTVAKKRLNNLGQLLKLNQHCIDSAFMFFKMALQMNLTRGRKSSIIDTACLYLVCRSEGTPRIRSTTNFPSFLNPPSVHNHLPYHSVKHCWEFLNNFHFRSFA